MITSQGYNAQFKFNSCALSNKENQFSSLLSLLSFLEMHDVLHSTHNVKHEEKPEDRLIKCLCEQEQGTGTVPGLYAAFLCSPA